MAQIIMLGTVGCGKTILLTVLAQKYRSVSEDGYFLEAMNAEANAFTNLNWHILTEQHEWPAATPPGALRSFRWQIHFGTNVEKSKLDLVAGDFSGETFQAAFGRNDLSSAEAQELKQYIDQSDALLLLINLKDFINEQDINRKSETEWALKNCLDYAVGQQFRQIAVAFSQIDRYQALFDECNGDDRAVLNKYLPQIAGAHPNVELLRVSAVNGTTITEGADGLAIERPAENFGSAGIPELLTWVSKTETRDKPLPPPLPSAIGSSLKPPTRQWLKPVIAMIAMVVGLALVIALKSCPGGGGGGGSSVIQQPVVPIPVITKDARLVGTGNFESYGIECWGRVVNKGAAGNVIVHVKFTQGTKESPPYTKAQRLDQGGSFDFYYKDTDTFYQRDGVISYSAWAE